MAGGLTARKVVTAKPGKYSDGGNLYLIVSDSGARKWVLRFTWRGRAKEMGLGSASNVSLADARDKAATARRKIDLGINPIDDRKRTGGVPMFGEMADQVREALSGGLEARGTRRNGNRRWRLTPHRCATSGWTPSAPMTCWQS
jgi:Arm DNA-binding domain